MNLTFVFPLCLYILVQPPSTESEVDGDELLGGLNKLKINNTVSNAVA